MRSSACNDPARERVLVLAVVGVYPIIRGATSPLSSRVRGPETPS